MKYLFSFFILFYSCTSPSSNKDIMDEKIFYTVYLEKAFASERVYSDNQLYPQLDKKTAYFKLINEIYKKYNIDSNVFNKSLNYYVSDTKRFGDFRKSINDSLNSLEKLK